MPQQHTKGLDKIIRDKFNVSVNYWLERCASKNLTYEDAQQIIGVSDYTIRKWARRLGIELQSSEKDKVLMDKYHELFTAKEMNEINFLSRRWDL